MTVDGSEDPFEAGRLQVLADLWPELSLVSSFSIVEPCQAGAKQWYTPA